jgi:hypothetical protein
VPRPDLPPSLLLCREQHKHYRDAEVTAREKLAEQEQAMRESAGKSTDHYQQFIPLAFTLLPSSSTAFPFLLSSEELADKARRDEERALQLQDAALVRKQEEQSARMRAAEEAARIERERLQREMAAAENAKQALAEQEVQRRRREAEQDQLRKVSNACADI